MDHIDTNILKHNPEAIKKCFRIKDNKTLVTKNIRIVFLSSFLDKELADIDDYVTLVGLYGIIDEDNNYGACVAPIYQKLSVNKIEDATCTDGREYKVLYVDKDSILINNNNLVITENQIFYICDEFFIKVKIPFYLSDELVCGILNETAKYNHSNVGSNRKVFEILTSIGARAKDKITPYRNSKEKGKVPPTWVPLSNIYYSLNSTSSKIIGGHYGKGVVSAILNPEEETTDLENLLRGKDL